jgi:Tfp pilus assembly protein PilF
MPQDPQDYLKEGYEFFETGDYQAAIQCFDRALRIEEIDPKVAAQARNNKGNAPGRLGRHEEAITCYDRALEIKEIDPEVAAQARNDKGWAWYNKGLALYELGRHEEAIENYEKAISIEETWYSCLGLARVCVMLGDRRKEETLYERALESLKGVKELYKEFSKDTAAQRDYHFLNGYANARLGRYGEAEEDFMRCGKDKEAKENLREVRKALKEGLRPCRELVIAGWVITGISGALLIACLTFYFWRFGRVMFGSGPAIANATEVDVLKVLIPTFLGALLIGIFLPYIKAFRGPGGVGLEMSEMVTKPQPIPAELKLTLPLSSKVGLGAIVPSI